MYSEQIVISKPILQGEDNYYRTSIHKEDKGNGIEEIIIKIQGDSNKVPSTLRVSFKFPSINIQGSWRPAIQNMEDGFNRSLAVNWDGWDGNQAANTVGAPIYCLYDVSGRNRITVAYSDVLNKVYMKMGVNEENAEIFCVVTLFKEEINGFSNYIGRIRIDTRDIPWYEAVQEVAPWWDSVAGITPSQIPECARLPMYSTWYSYHQAVKEQEIEKQCYLAKQIGCEAVIMDDGWQLSEVDHGYSHTGDWEPQSEKIISMKEHVQRVHNLGMKYLLWYSVPFVGFESKSWDIFRDKILSKWEEKGAGVLDPRFPEVREYLIEKYELAFRDWDIDGLKLDFVDCFNVKDRDQVKFGEGRDFDSIQEAVDKLLSDIIVRLRRIKSDVLVEFRQPYNGPLMRKYGNMLRAWDCANDAIENRVRTIDIRMLSQTTPVHSDMIIWHEEDKVESVALQLQNIIFAVPQISVKLDIIPEVHKRMLQFWLQFSRTNLDVLQQGTLMPLYPQHLYPIVGAFSHDKLIIAVYSEFIVRIEETTVNKIFLINAKSTENIVLDIRYRFDNCQVTTMNCCGERIESYQMMFVIGLHNITIPASGLVEIKLK